MYLGTPDTIYNQSPRQCLIFLHYSRTRRLYERIPIATATFLQFSLHTDNETAFMEKQKQTKRRIRLG
jgi:hypothetical protein